VKAPLKQNSTLFQPNQAPKSQHAAGFLLSRQPQSSVGQVLCIPLIPPFLRSKFFGRMLSMLFNLPDHDRWDIKYERGADCFDNLL
jgi:hypothetical protein